MFTDIVGYTRLMQQDESMAVTIRNRYRQVVEFVHQKYGGKILRYYGNGTLSIFESATVAVHAAIAIQTQLQVSPQVPLRTGIHLGDGRITGSDINGNRDKLASWLATFGMVGAILVSDQVMEVISEQNIPTILIGTFQFKNDEFPRNIYAVNIPGLKVPQPESLMGKTEKKPAAHSKAETAQADLKLLSKEDRFLRLVKKIIQDNLINPQFSVEVLSKEAGYSRPQLYRKVKTLTKRSPTDLIREIRLEKAAQLLRNNTGNVSEIAYETGFNNLSYFSKAFQEHFGISPSVFSRSKTKRAGAPAFLTQFIGREQEITEILRILKESRLLTLTGTGGTGKTRLAMELMSRIAYSPKTFFIQLAPLGDPQQVLPKIAQILKIPQDPTRDTVELVRDYINHQKFLLILDNFEHVVSAAPRIRELLLSCPHLKIIVTSRVNLKIQGEQEFVVPQLSIPKKENLYDLDELADIQSVKLFINRVKNVKPNFELNDNNQQSIIDICSSLDGLPLALELAATRIKLFSPEALLRRLSKNLDILKSNSPGQPDRHRTLRNTIDWSYSLLAPEEQTLFRRLCVFNGSFTIEAAEAVCFQDYIRNFDIIDILTGLADKSLLLREDQADGDPRFHILETIKAYGLEKLDRSLEQASVMQHYANYFQKKFARANQHLTGAGMDEWLALIDLELDNIRAVLMWLEEKKDAENGLQFAVSIWRFWTIRTMMREGANWLKRMLNIPSRQQASLVRCKALNAYGVLFVLTNQFESNTMFQKSLAIARELQYEEGIAQALSYLAWYYQFQCDFDLCDQYSAEAMAIYQKLNNQRGIATTYNNLGFVARQRGQLKDALHYFETAARIMQGIGERRGYAYNLSGKGWILSLMGAYNESNQVTREALEILNEMDDKQLIAFGQSIHAFNLCYSGRLDESLDLAKCSRPLWQKSGNNYGVIMCDIIMGTILLINKQYRALDELLSNAKGDSPVGNEKFFECWKDQLRARLMIKNEEFDKAQSQIENNLLVIIEKDAGLLLPDELELMAEVSARQALNKQAVLLCSFAQQLRETHRIKRPPIWQEDHERLLHLIKMPLVGKEFQSLWAEGRHAGPEDVLALITSRNMFKY